MSKRGNWNLFQIWQKNLRALVAERDLGVLQRCAAYIDAALPVYVCREDQGRPDFFTEATVVENLADAERIPPYTEPIDLDRWLELTSISDPLGNKNHRELIRVIADTLGAHSDPGVHDFVIRHGFRFPNGDLHLGILGVIMDQYARMVVKLAESVVEQAS